MLDFLYRQSDPDWLINQEGVSKCSRTLVHLEILALRPSPGSAFFVCYITCLFTKQVSFKFNPIKHVKYHAIGEQLPAKFRTP